MLYRIFSQPDTAILTYRLNSLSRFSSPRVNKDLKIFSTFLAQTRVNIKFVNRMFSKSDKSNSSSNLDEQQSKNNSIVNKQKFSATKEELKARLSPIQYQVTQLKSTERPGSGEYNKFDKKGTYHCIVCDEVLFKSDTKFDSGCGWPAFFDAADEKKLKFVQDYALIGSGNLLLLAKKADLIRTEVLCGNCNAHLGHKFDDGPISKGGKRYCINSAALRFEPGPK